MGWTAKSIAIGPEETVRYVSMKFSSEFREGFTGMSLMNADHLPIKSNTGGEQWLIEQEQVAGDE